MYVRSLTSHVPVETDREQGVYGDKETTLARFRENYRTRLTDEMKAWVVLENDEVSCPRQPKLVIAT